MAKYTNIAGIKLGKSSKPSKFNKNRNYSDFWMGIDDWYSSKQSKFSGLTGEESHSSDLVKLIKMNSYRKAIANFVKILTNKNIPVTFTGNMSYTDFDKIVISSDVKDTNFDVYVGLALHEASHILLTTPTYFKDQQDLWARGNHPSNKGNGTITFNLWKSLVNWIEDRRIDNYVFRTSPGYKAYYHKLYDYYWNDKSVAAALKSADYRNPSSEDSWLIHIINSLNPASDRNALPGLDRVLDLINVAHISRLKTTEEVGDLANEVCDIISKAMINPALAKEEDKQQAMEQQGSGNGSGSKGNEDEGNTGSDSGDNGEGDPAANTGSEELESLSADQRRAIEKALQKQKNFLDGNTAKKSVSKALKTKLDNVEDSAADVQSVMDGKYSTIVYNLDTMTDNVNNLLTAAQEFRDYIDAREKENAPAYRMTPEYEALRDKVTSIINKLPDGFCSASQNKDAVTKGLELGALLGKKLQVRNEVRELVYQRLRTGGIDNKRLAQAGFGVETIFKQIHVDQYKKANLHISVDASGSMGGTKWKRSVQMVAAIAKAAEYIKNLDIQVSFRATTNQGKSAPVTINVYDSRINKLHHLVRILEYYSPSTYTPEGLCFEAAVKQHSYIKGTNTCDSYFLNLSDGMPAGITGYEGEIARVHTKKIVDEMRNQLNMKVLSFFINEGDNPQYYMNSATFKNFQQMYSVKDSKVVSADSVVEIARALNERFLSAESRM